MKPESPWIIGRQAIGDYAGVSVWTVTMMIKAGLKCYGGKKHGSEPRSKPEWIDGFFDSHPNFTARDYMKKNKPAGLRTL